MINNTKDFIFIGLRAVSSQYLPYSFAFDVWPSPPASLLLLAMLLPAGLVIQHNVHQCLFTSNINLSITSVYCEFRQKQWQRTSDDDTKHKKDGHEHKSTEHTLIFCVCAEEGDSDIQHSAAIGTRMQYVPEKEYCDCTQSILSVFKY